MLRLKLFCTVFLTIFIGLVQGFSQKGDAPIFKTVKQIQATPVKNQANSGTCWAFATTSFLESELIRLGKGEFDISEMYFVRMAYMQKAINYVRLHGLCNFGQGGQAHDVTNVLLAYGLVPESVYVGLKPGEIKHDHTEVELMLKGILTPLAKQDNISTVWRSAVEGILDSYFGKLPTSFDYKGKNYSPLSFAKENNLNAEDYIEITSFTHHPYYKQFKLEVPDNWSFDSYYNVTLDDLILIMDNAINNGYTIAWDGDVSEKTFSNDLGYAKMPTSGKGVEVSETPVTEAMRQTAFDNYSTTDDHLMHITGITKDQNGTKYYITKNSWGEKGNDFGGYINLSEQFVRYKTIAILTHKNAVPLEMAKKLGLK